MKYLISFILLALGQAAHGVCVNGHPTVEQEFDTALLVVQAVLKFDRSVPGNDNENFDGGNNYTVKITRVFKGRPPSTLTIFSENNSGRFPMEVGESYVLFIGKDVDATWSVSNCGNSGLSADIATVIMQIERLSADNGSAGKIRSEDDAE